MSNTSTYNFSNIQYICKQCSAKTICNYDNEIVCEECGLIQETVLYDTYSFEQQSDFSNSKNNTFNSSNNKINKMQQWYMWSNDEKNNYKLSNYTKSLCLKLEIHESLINIICQTVVEVMTIIKKYEGTKRARVKDGIILTCIQYVSKNTHNILSANDLAKRIQLDTKYITKAEKIILELINSNKLNNLNKSSIIDVKKSFQYIEDVIYKHNLKINHIILKQVQILINFCEQNDILLDHTPLSIGVCCFYYILNLHHINIDMKLFSELYDLSVVTVLKTLNKLKQYENILPTFTN
jgi:transcription initiation factor TFIIIB Brf1 subunit/transcription initiation factor TFIIB